MFIYNGRILRRLVQYWYSSQEDLQYHHRLLRVEKITKFADVVEKLDFVPWFSAYIRADLLIARPRDREELLRMNLTGHYYGIETFNRESGKIIGKGYDTEK